MLRIKELIVPAWKISAQNILCKIVKQTLVLLSISAHIICCMFFYQTFNFVKTFDEVCCRYSIDVFTHNYYYGHCIIVTNNQTNHCIANTIVFDVTLLMFVILKVVWKMAILDRWHFSYFRSQIVQICFWRFHPIFLTFYNKLVPFNLVWTWTWLKLVNFLTG